MTMAIREKFPGWREGVQPTLPHMSVQNNMAPAEEETIIEGNRQGGNAGGGEIFNKHFTDGPGEILPLDDTQDDISTAEIRHNVTLCDKCLSAVFPRLRVSNCSQTDPQVPVGPSNIEFYALFQIIKPVPVLGYRAQIIELAHRAPEVVRQLYAAREVAVELPEDVPVPPGPAPHRPPARPRIYMTVSARLRQEAVRRRYAR